MLKGVYLTLMVGPVVPIPVPKPVLDALTEVQVTTAAGTPSGFSMSFTLSNRSPLHTLFSDCGSTNTVTARDHRGDDQRTSERPDGRSNDESAGESGAANPANPRWTITGEDLTKVMSLIDFSGLPYPAMPPRRAWR